MITDILKRICDRRLQDVMQAKQQISLAQIEQWVRDQQHHQQAKTLAQVAAQKKSNRQRVIIAEIKRASPSKGIIAQDLDAGKQALLYANGGAAAISVLTEPHEFLGQDDDLRQVRQLLPHMPILRKDFTVDPYQIWQTAQMGANIVLLLVNVLGNRLPDFLLVAKQAGLEALVEVHDESELNIAIDSGAQIIGINARNLRTFDTKFDHVMAMLELCPSASLKIAESGIATHEDIIQLEAAGADAFLIGETLVRHPHPDLLLQDWVKKG